MTATNNLHLILILALSLASALKCFATATIPQELGIGFSAIPESSTTPFQAVLSDPTGNFSLGFLRTNENQLTLAILHVASSEPFWMATPAHVAASWSDSTRLFFNGSLVLSDPNTRVWWSTGRNGERVILLNSSNLQVLSKGTPVWESYRYPANSLVQGQNFTSDMSLVSRNGFYSLRLGDKFMGLYQNHGEEGLLYWKHSALEAKAEIKEGEGPIYARVNPEGYLGMYQTSAKPVDVEKFNSFQQPFTTASFLFVRLEADGNLKGYYWDGSKWLLNYQAITEICDLPSPCGSYGFCTPGGSGCSCLDNRTRFEPDGCFADGGSGNLCEGRIGGSGYRVLRRSGVEPPHKELLGHVTTSSLAECEGLCENNCSCWGALYNNQTGFCYVLDYPIQTMLGSGDGSKLGYFKVRKSERGRNGVRVGIVVAVLLGVSVVVVGVVGVCVMRWKRRRGVGLNESDGASPGPYKNLGSASFRSIEMCSNSGSRE